MPKFTASFASQNGFDLDDFSGFSRDWFPEIGDPQNPLVTTNTWSQQQLFALDASQRAITTALGQSSGIPFLSDQAAAQVGFLKSVPAIDKAGEIWGKFQTLSQAGAQPEAAIEAALSLINEFGFEALQGAILEGAELAAGVVEVVPIIGAFVKMGISFGKTYYQAFKSIDTRPTRVPLPAYEPEADYVASDIIHTASTGRKWTGVFSPAHWRIPLADSAAPQIVAGKGFASKAPHFAGRRTEQDREYIFSQWGGGNVTAPKHTQLEILPNSAEHFGFVPLSKGEGGVLWRGILIDKLSKETALVGDRLPTAQSMGLALWRSVFNPYAPQIFFVDAVRLGNEWLNYLVQLRRGLHLSHQQKAAEFLKNWKSTDLDVWSKGAAQLWLSFSKVEDGDVKKRMDLRRKVCDALKPVFGWRGWTADDEAMVGKYSKVMSVSDDDYVTLFGLNNAAPIRACRDLYGRQFQAAQSVTVVYSREDDEAFRNASDLRRLRDQSLNRLVNSPERRSLVDEDMIQPGVFAQAAKNLWQPGVTPATAPTVKAAIYQPDKIWLGDKAAPGEWAGRDTTTTLAAAGTSQGGGGAAAVALLGGAAAAAYFFMGGR